MPLPTSEDLKKAREKAAQAKVRLQALEARISLHERKQDSRRKIILGSLLIDGAASDPACAAMLNTLIGRVTRDQDRTAFEGWTPPGQPSTSPFLPSSPSSAGQAGQQELATQSGMLPLGSSS